MQNHLFLKEKSAPDGTEFEGYTTLVGLLASEGLLHIYRSISYRFAQQEEFRKDLQPTIYFKDIIIRKVKLNHQKHGK